jgi:uncharacterized cupin superfamily protein
MEKPIVNVKDLNYQEFPGVLPEHLKEKYGGSKLGQAAAKIGAEKLGYNVTIVPPGRRAFQFHSHKVNEEMFFILEGEGEVRVGENTFLITAGDFIAHPPGSPAHQIINTSTKELRYLAVSTKEGPEIAEYPDSKKFGVLSKDFRFLGHMNESLDYWDGE